MQCLVGFQVWRLGPLAESGLGRLREKLVLPGPISVRVSLRAGSVTWVFRPRSLWPISTPGDRPNHVGSLLDFIGLDKASQRLKSLIFAG